jgi:putative aldouronate transport system permease protein
VKQKISYLDLIIYPMLAVIGICTLYPLWNITVIAANNSLDSLRGGLYLWPRQFTPDNFKAIFSLPQLTTAFINSVVRTICGSVLSVFSISMVGYVLCRKEFIFRKPVSTLFVITMYVNGGMIPMYFVIKGLGLMNHFPVYLLPMLIQPYYLFITSSYMRGLPESLVESARIDGANDLQIFFRLVLPISTPIIATLFLFTAVDQWNSWVDTFLYTSSNKALTTLQYEMVKLLSQSTASVSSYEDLRRQLSGSGVVTTTPESIRMAITVVATVPVLVVYPFVQKYFIQGLTLGVVKG